MKSWLLVHAACFSVLQLKCNVLCIYDSVFITFSTSLPKVGHLFVKPFMFKLIISMLLEHKHT